MSRARGRRPIRVLELRSVWGTGGGPEKTILLGAERADPERVAVTVCYLRDLRDRVFSIDTRARGKVAYVEILEQHSFDPHIWSRLRRLVRDGDFDIVHAHDYKTDFFAYLLSLFESVIPLATVHGWIRTSLREKIYCTFDRRLLARFPRVLVVSTPIREDLLRSGAAPERVHLVLNAIDPDAFRRDRSRQNAARLHFGVDGDAFVLGAVGRLEREKRFDLLLEAFAELRRERPVLRLLVAGHGSLADELRAQANRLGLESSVRFLGQVNDIVAFHHAIDLFIQCSDLEGTPNAVLEAMALESPVVATAVGGTAELARDGEHAILLPARSTEALVAAIRRVVDDPGGARRRALAARQRVETDLSFASRMRAVEAIYEELVERADTPRHARLAGT